MRVVSLAVQLLHDRFGNTANVGIRGAGRDDEEISGVRQATQVEYHQLTALQIGDRVQRQAKRFGNARRHRPFASCMSVEPSAPARVPSRARDTSAAARLWSVAEDLTGVALPAPPPHR